MGAVMLGRASLARLHPPVRVPRFDRSAMRAGIVHLGLGNFHRAHMARYTHELMERRPDALEWGIIGAGLLPADRQRCEDLAEQDGLYTLVERSDAEESVSAIGSLAGIVYAGESSAALLDAIDAEGIRIVSLTVSENGYCLDRSTKRLDPGNLLVRQDLAEPGRPRSAIGVIVEALRRRRDAERTPFTSLSCDNIEHNGKVLRDAVLSLAALRDPALAAWIEEGAAFPSGMVDRITPVTTPADIAALEARHGIRDRAPVFSETFSQWVIEDRFPSGRPPWEEVGVEFVADVSPYEAMKLRLLNTSHLAVAGLGRLAGYAYVHDCLRDPDIRAYMAALMERETGPTVPPIPGVDLGAYQRTLLERFGNPAIRDTVDRINTDAPLNLLLDPIRDRVREGSGLELLALALAAWLRRVRGEDEGGRPIQVAHPLAPMLRERAIAGGSDPRPLLGIATLFGDLGADPRLVSPVQRWLTSLYAVGTRATLARARNELRF
jgi:fructuronate reductase/mannitol 2-dehydrogenase